MDDERDAEDAIRGLDRIEFGRKGRRLRVEWTKVYLELLIVASIIRPIPSKRFWHVLSVLHVVCHAFVLIV